MITFVFCLSLLVMSLCMFLSKRSPILQRALRLRPYGAISAQMTSASNSDFPDNNVASICSRTTLASVEGMVLQSVHTLLKDKQIRADDLGSFKPMVFPGKPEFGDYQCNIALTLSKQLKLKPKEVAERLMSTMINSDAHSAIPVIESMDMSGPGFINIHLSPRYLQHKLQHMQTHSAGQEDGSLSRLGIEKVTSPQKIVVDFSSPNIAKEMHVGHLRSTLIGDSLARVLEFLGHDVLRLNHVGDWGTQFGMLIHYLKTHHPSSLSLSGPGDALEQPQQQTQAKQLRGVNIGDLVEFYKAAKRCFDSDPAFKEASRREVVQLQTGDSQSLAAWTAICDKSRAEFQQIYKLLNVNLTERGESFYNPLLPGLMQRLKESGAVQTSEGAECIFVEGYKNSDGTPLPLIVQKSDGGYLYATTDLAALYHRVHDEAADRVIYVTDAGQAQHFAMVFKAAEMAGILHENNSKRVELTHVPFGLVLGEDGKKIKSRAGDSVKLRELLAEAVRLAAENEAAKIGSNSAVAGVATPTLGQVGGVGNVLSALEQGPLGLGLQDKARIIGLGAVKYADLSMHRESNYKFSFNKMLSLSGNTAPYMLYAYVRIRGIQRKAAASLQGEDENQRVESHMVLDSPAELALAKQLVRFHEVLLDVSTSLCPNKLCEYMYELAQRFNSFYESCPVLQAETRELRVSRTALCALTADTLKLSLDLLGIDTVEKM